MASYAESSARKASAIRRGRVMMPLMPLCRTCARQADSRAYISSVHVTAGRCRGFGNSSK